MEDKEKRK